MMAELFLLQALKKKRKGKKKLLKAHNVPLKKRFYVLQFHKTSTKNIHKDYQAICCEA